MAGAWPQAREQRGSGGAALALAGPLALPGNHTHGGSRTLVIRPGALQGCLLDRSGAGDEGRDVENGGTHVKYHQLGGGEKGELA